MRQFALASCATLAVSCAVTAQTQMPLPAFERTYVGNVRGYWFEAPIDFCIVALRVPDETGFGEQSVEVVRFDNNTPPPAFPGVTNDFQSLARFVNEPSNARLPVQIPVRAGEIIGIYGQCGTANSYGAVEPFLSEIFGRPTVLTRSGMQFQLNSGPMRDIWEEAAFNVCRVEMYYEEQCGTGCPCACAFDTSTGPGVCDIFDFLGFQDAFVGAEPCACDIDTSTGPGVCDIFDFLAFQDEFVGGCP